MSFCWPRCSLFAGCFSEDAWHIFDSKTFHGYRGMVESAFEFADICRALDFHNFLFSMKASNPLVMVQAYRLLAEEMYKKGWDYPLHLGVTEVL